MSSRCHHVGSRRRGTSTFPSSATPDALVRPRRAHGAARRVVVSRSGAMVTILRFSSHACAPVPGDLRAVAHAMDLARQAVRCGTDDVPHISGDDSHSEIPIGDMIGRSGNFWWRRWDLTPRTSCLPGPWRWCGQWGRGGCCVESLISMLGPAEATTTPRGCSNWQWLSYGRRSKQAAFPGNGG